ncbi:hypothetical protein CRG98_006981, partial [Punica granatum]
MNTAAPSSSSSSCIPAASRNPNLNLLLFPSHKNGSRCTGLQLEASSSSSGSFQGLPRNCVVGRYAAEPLGAVATSDAPGATSPSVVGEDKIGVLLLNLGGPETLDDVQPFLFNLFADPDIIRLPRLFRFLQKPLAQFISVLRAPKSKEGYASIGGGSPLRQITDAQ